MTTIATSYGALAFSLVAVGINSKYPNVSEKFFQIAEGCLLYGWTGANGAAILFTASKTVYEGVKNGCEAASQVFKASIKSGGLIRDTLIAPIYPFLCLLRDRCYTERQNV